MPFVNRQLSLFAPSAQSLILAHSSDDEGSGGSGEEEEERPFADCIPDPPEEEVMGPDGEAAKASYEDTIGLLTGILEELVAVRPDDPLDYIINELLCFPFAVDHSGAGPAGGLVSAGPSPRISVSLGALPPNSAVAKTESNSSNPSRQGIGVGISDAARASPPQAMRTLSSSQSHSALVQPSASGSVVPPIVAPPAAPPQCRQCAAVPGTRFYSMPPLSAFAAKEPRCCVYEIQSPFQKAAGETSQVISKFLSSNESVIVIVGDDEEAVRGHAAVEGCHSTAATAAAHVPVGAAFSVSPADSSTPHPLSRSVSPPLSTYSGSPSQQGGGCGGGGCPCYGAGKSRLAKWLAFPGRYVHGREVISVDGGSTRSFLDLLEGGTGNGASNAAAERTVGPTDLDFGATAASLRVGLGGVRESSPDFLAGSVSPQHRVLEVACGERSRSMSIMGGGGGGGAGYGYGYGSNGGIGVAAQPFSPNRTRRRSTKASALLLAETYNGGGGGLDQTQAWRVREKAVTRIRPTLTLIDSVEPPHYILHQLHRQHYFRTERAVRCPSCGHLSTNVAVHKTVIFTRRDVFFRFPLPCPIYVVSRRSIAKEALFSEADAALADAWSRRRLSVGWQLGHVLPQGFDVGDTGERRATTPRRPSAFALFNSQHNNNSSGQQHQSSHGSGVAPLPPFPALRASVPAINVSPSSARGLLAGYPHHHPQQQQQRWGFGRDSLSLSATRGGLGSGPFSPALLSTAAPRCAVEDPAAATPQWAATVLSELTEFYEAARGTAVGERSPMTIACSPTFLAARLSRSKGELYVARYLAAGTWLPAFDVSEFPLLVKYLATMPPSADAYVLRLMLKISGGGQKSGKGESAPMSDVFPPLPQVEEAGDDGAAGDSGRGSEPPSFGPAMPYLSTDAYPYPPSTCALSAQSAVPLPPHARGPSGLRLAVANLLCVVLKAQQSLTLRRVSATAHDLLALYAALLRQQQQQQRGGGYGTLCNGFGSSSRLLAARPPLAAHHGAASNQKAAASADCDRRLFTPTTQCAARTASLKGGGFGGHVDPTAAGALGSVPVTSPPLSPPERRYTVCGLSGGNAAANSAAVMHVGSSPIAVYHSRPAALGIPDLLRLGSNLSPSLRAAAAAGRPPPLAFVDLQDLIVGAIGGTGAASRGNSMWGGSAAAAAFSANTAVLDPIAGSLLDIRGADLDDSVVSRLTASDAHRRGPQPPGRKDSGLGLSGSFGFGRGGIASVLMGAGHTTDVPASFAGPVVLSSDASHVGESGGDGLFAPFPQQGSQQYGLPSPSSAGAATLPLQRTGPILHCFFVRLVSEGCSAVLVVERNRVYAQSSFAEGATGAGPNGAGGPLNLPSPQNASMGASCSLPRGYGGFGGPAAAASTASAASASGHFWTILTGAARGILHAHLLSQNSLQHEARWSPVPGLANATPGEGVVGAEEGELADGVDGASPRAAQQATACAAENDVLVLLLDDGTAVLVAINSIPRHAVVRIDRAGGGGAGREAARVGSMLQRAGGIALLSNHIFRSIDSAAGVNTITGNSNATIQQGVNESLRRRHSAVRFGPVTETCLSASVTSVDESPASPPPLSPHPPLPENEESDEAAMGLRESTGGSGRRGSIPRDALAGTVVLSSTMVTDGEGFGEGTVVSLDVAGIHQFAAVAPPLSVAALSAAGSPISAHHTEAAFSPYGLAASPPVAGTMPQGTHPAAWAESLQQRRELGTRQRTDLFSNFTGAEGGDGGSGGSPSTITDGASPATMGREATSTVSLISSGGGAKLASGGGLPLHPPFPSIPFASSGNGAAPSSSSAPSPSPAPAVVRIDNFLMSIGADVLKNNDGPMMTAMSPRYLAAVARDTFIVSVVEHGFGSWMREHEMHTLSPLVPSVPSGPPAPSAFFSPTSNSASVVGSAPALGGFSSQNGGGSSGVLDGSFASTPQPPTLRRTTASPPRRAPLKAARLFQADDDVAHLSILQDQFLLVGLVTGDVQVFNLDDDREEGDSDDDESDADDDSGGGGMLRRTNRGGKGGAAEPFHTFQFHESAVTVIRPLPGPHAATVGVGPSSSSPSSPMLTARHGNANNGYGGAPLVTPRSVAVGRSRLNTERRHCFITGAADNTLSIFSIDDCTQLKSARVHQAPIVDVCATNFVANRVIVSCDASGVVIVSAVNPFDLQAVFVTAWSSTVPSVGRLHLSYDGSWLCCVPNRGAAAAAAGAGVGAIVHSSGSGVFGGGATADSSASLTSSFAMMGGLSALQQPSSASSASASAALPIVLPISEWARLGVAQFHTRPITCVHLTTCEGFLLTGGADGVVFVWDLAAQARHVLSFRKHALGSAIVSISTSADGSRVASSDDRKFVQLWRRKCGTVIRTVDRADGEAFCRFLPFDFLAVRTRNDLRLYDGEDKLVLRSRALGGAGAEGCGAGTIDFFMAAPEDRDCFPAVRYRQRKPPQAEQHRKSQSSQTRARAASLSTAANSAGDGDEATESTATGGADGSRRETLASSATDGGSGAFSSGDNDGSSDDGETSPRRGLSRGATLRPAASAGSITDCNTTAEEADKSSVVASGGEGQVNSTDGSSSSSSSNSDDSDSDSSSPSLRKGGGGSSGDRGGLFRRVRSFRTRPNDNVAALNDPLEDSLQEGIADDLRALCFVGIVSNNDGAERYGVDIYRLGELDAPPVYRIERGRIRRPPSTKVRSPIDSSDDSSDSSDEDEEVRHEDTIQFFTFLKPSTSVKGGLVVVNNSAAGTPQAKNCRSALNVSARDGSAFCVGGGAAGERQRDVSRSRIRASFIDPFALTSLRGDGAINGDGGDDDNDEGSCSGIGGPSFGGGPTDGDALAATSAANRLSISSVRGDSARGSLSTGTIVGADAPPLLPPAAVDVAAAATAAHSSMCAATAVGNGALVSTSSASQQPPAPPPPPTLFLAATAGDDLNVVVWNWRDQVPLACLPHNAYLNGLVFWAPPASMLLPPSTTSTSAPQLTLHSNGDGGSAACGALRGAHVDPCAGTTEANRRVSDPADGNSGSATATAEGGGDGEDTSDEALFHRHDPTYRYYYGGGGREKGAEEGGGCHGDVTARGEADSPPKRNEKEEASESLLPPPLCLLYTIQDAVGGEEEPTVRVFEVREAYWSFLERTRPAAPSLPFRGAFGGFGGPPPPPPPAVPATSAALNRLRLSIRLAHATRRFGGAAADSPRSIAVRPSDGMVCTGGAELVFWRWMCPRPLITDAALSTAVGHAMAAGGVGVSSRLAGAYGSHDALSPLCPPFEGLGDVVASDSSSTSSSASSTYEAAFASATTSHQRHLGTEGPSLGATVSARDSGLSCEGRSCDGDDLNATVAPRVVEGAGGQSPLLAPSAPQSRRLSTASDEGSSPDRPLMRNGGFPRQAIPLPGGVGAEGEGVNDAPSSSSSRASRSSSASSYHRPLVRNGGLMQRPPSSSSSSSGSSSSSEHRPLGLVRNGGFQQQQRLRARGGSSSSSSGSSTPRGLGMGLRGGGGGFGGGGGWGWGGRPADVLAERRRQAMVDEARLLAETVMELRPVRRIAKRL